MLMSSIGQSGSKKNMTSFPFLPTFTINGLGHEQEIVDEYVGRGVNSIYLRCVNRTGRAHESGYDIGVAPQAFVGAWKHVLDYVLEKSRNGSTIREGQTAYLLSNMLFSEYDYMCLRKPCGCGISQVVVGPDGTLHGCDGDRSVEMLTMGNVLTNGYDEVFSSDTAIALRTLASETLPECQTCPFGSYCGYCVARGVNQHGSPIPNIPFDSECQMYKEMIPYLFRSALVTGALLTSTLLGVMLASPASAGEHCDRWHWNHCHSNSPMYTDGYGCHSHYHENWDGPCYT